MFYYIAIMGLKIYLNLRFKIKVFGKENIPKDTGVIFCSNHSSNFDPVIVCININRKVHYLAKKELFNTKFKNYWMRKLATIPIDREKTDVVALKNSIKILKENKCLGIFAQGTRNLGSNEDVSAKNGVAFFALKSGVPVVPIGIKSTYENKGLVKVNIGKPIYFDKYKNEKIKSELLNKVTDEIMLEVKNLVNQE